VWIGAHVTILDGVRIGDGAIVGAHSLVRENVPPRTVVAGTPARIIRELD
jgi:acetyltransferase-like isoleucine patch superfamily enzyme